MAIHGRAIAAACVVVAVGALVVAYVLSAWALAVLPFALVIGVASWRGVGLEKTLQVMADTPNDPGSGPAGVLP